MSRTMRSALVPSRSKSGESAVRYQLYDFMAKHSEVLSM
jgi:hypothetical protein